MLLLLQRRVACSPPSPIVPLSKPLRTNTAATTTEALYNAIIYRRNNVEHLRARVAIDASVMVT